MQPVLAVRGLRKAYGDRLALDGVDLTLGEGQVHGLLGSNGAGKTTLLRVLLGLVRPDAGSIEYCGRPLAGRERPRGLAGFAETPRFYPYLSGRQTLTMLADLDGGSDPRAIDDALDAVELTARADDRTGGYSLGMRQRLGLAAALLRRPRLLLLDEPANGLDPSGARQLRRLITDVTSRGTTVLLSSHDMSEVEQICDSVTVLAEGRTVYSGTLDELRRQAPTASYRLTTSDDRRALRIAREYGLHVSAHELDAPFEDGLRVEASEAAVDELVLTLGRAGIAVRRLSLQHAPLEHLFLTLTERPVPLA